MECVEERLQGFAISSKGGLYTGNIDVARQKVQVLKPSEYVDHRLQRQCR
jgi:hypothetical protein